MVAFEKHYTVEQIAEMWNLSRDSVRRLFLAEAGVLKISRPGTRYKRAYTTLRIPESILNRVYQRMVGGRIA
jgi:transcriptional regulator GlxA family with amidase domain